MVQDKAYKAYVDKVCHEIEKINQTPFFKVLPRITCIAGDLRTRECYFPSLIADLIRIHTETQFTIFQAGHIRSEQQYEEGQILLKLDALKIFALIYSYVIVNATGKRIKQFLEEGYQIMPRAAGAFCQLSQNLQVTLDLSKPPLSRIESLLYNGKPIEDDKLYQFSTLGFAADGYDGFTGFEKGSLIKASTRTKYDVC